MTKQQTKSISSDELSPFDIFGTDASREADGVVIDYGAFWFKIGSADSANPRYVAALKRLFEPHKRAFRAGVLADKVAEQIMVEVAAHGVVFAWGSKKHGDGKMIDQDGSAIPFSPEAVVELFGKLPKLYSEVMKDANDLKNFRAVQLEEDAGN